MQGATKVVSTETNHSALALIAAKGPSYARDYKVTSEQLPLDPVEEAEMESFPCSYSPFFSRAHA